MPRPFIVWQQDVPESSMVAHLEEKIRHCPSRRRAPKRPVISPPLRLFSVVHSPTQSGTGAAQLLSPQMQIGHYPPTCPLWLWFITWSSKLASWDNQHNQVHLNFTSSQWVGNSSHQNTALCHSAMDCNCPLGLTGCYSVSQSMPPNLTGWFCSC